MSLSQFLKFFYSSHHFLNLLYTIITPIHINPKRKGIMFIHNVYLEQKDYHTSNKYLLPYPYVYLVFPYNKTNIYILSFHFIFFYFVYFKYCRTIIFHFYTLYIKSFYFHVYIKFFRLKIIS